MTKVLQKSADNYIPRGHLDPIGFQQHVSFQRYQPPESLSPFVSHFWTISWDRVGERPYISEQVLHQPYVDIYISKQESGIQCTFRDRRDYKAADSGRIIGARLFPGAFHALWQKSLADLYNTTISLKQVFPDINDAVIEKLLSLPDEAAVYRLAELIQSKKPLTDRNIVLVNEIISAIEMDNLRDVKAVAQRFGRSERWLQQLFQEYVGIGIKWLLQRNRLIEAAILIRDEDTPNWAALAFDLGYSSQQHFITDFKHVIGKTPIQYKKSLANNP